MTNDLIELANRMEREADNMELNENLDSMDDGIALMRKAIAALRAGAGDAVDAARYRWLREQHWSDGVIAVVPSPKTAVKLGHDCPSLDRLDEIIDASRSALSQPAQSGPTDDEPRIDLRSLIERAGRTQADLAHLVGSRSRASEYLSGQRSPTVDVLRRLRVQWRIPLDDLLGIQPAQSRNDVIEEVVQCCTAASFELSAYDPKQQYAAKCIDMLMEDIRALKDGGRTND